MSASCPTYHATRGSCMAPYTIWVAKRATGSAISPHQHAAPHARPLLDRYGCGRAVYQHVRFRRTVALRSQPAARFLDLIRQTKARLGASLMHLGRVLRWQRFAIAGLVAIFAVASASHDAA